MHKPTFKFSLSYNKTSNPLNIDYSLDKKNVQLKKLLGEKGAVALGCGGQAFHDA